MKRLLLLRHAKSNWDDASVADHERPLAPRGHVAAGELARRLPAMTVAPDVVLCSTALRARQTLEAVRPALPPGAEVVLEHELYGASVEELLARIRRLPAPVQAVLVIGHNPGLQDLVAELTGSGDPALVDRVHEKFPTCALATLRLDVDEWRLLGPGTAELAALWVPERHHGGK